MSTKDFFATRIIHQSPYASAAADWNDLFARAQEIERKFGPRYLWEADFADKLDAAADEADAAHSSVRAWQPETREQRRNRFDLLSDLECYRNHMTCIAGEIKRWPTYGINVRFFKLTEMIAMNTPPAPRAESDDSDPGFDVKGRL